MVRGPDAGEWGGKRIATEEGDVAWMVEWRRAKHDTIIAGSFLSRVEHLVDVWIKSGATCVGVEIGPHVRPSGEDLIERVVFLGLSAAKRLHIVKVEIADHNHAPLPRRPCRLPIQLVERLHLRSPVEGRVERLEMDRSNHHLAAKVRRRNKRSPHPRRQESNPRRSGISRVFGQENHSILVDMRPVNV